MYLPLPNELPNCNWTSVAGLCRRPGSGQPRDKNPDKYWNCMISTMCVFATRYQSKMYILLKPSTRAVLSGAAETKQLLNHGTNHQTIPESHFAEKRSANTLQCVSRHIFRQKGERAPGSAAIFIPLGCSIFLCVKQDAWSGCHGQWQTTMPTHTFVTNLQAQSRWNPLATFFSSKKSRACVRGLHHRFLVLRRRKT